MIDTAAITDIALPRSTGVSTDLRMSIGKSLPVDLSAFIIAVATGVSVPPPLAAHGFPTTAAIHASALALRTDPTRKSASEQDLVIDSPTWLHSRLDALRARGFQRKNM